MDYTSEQIAAWGGRLFNADNLKNNIDQDVIWVVECNGRVQGFGHLKKTKVQSQETAFILALYLAPEALGVGAGQKILNHLETQAKEWGFKEIYLESTLRALGFYVKNGFNVTGPVTSCKINGTPIPCHPMKRFLV